MAGGDEDKRHRRAGQGSVGHGLHFPPDRIDKRHQGLARISLAPSHPETRPSVCAQALKGLPASLSDP